MRSGCKIPLNIGSDEMVTINQLVDFVSSIAGKKIKKNYIEGPQGVRGRNSDNNLIFSSIGWKPTKSLTWGLEKTYRWIEEQISK